MHLYRTKPFSDKCQTDELQHVDLQCTARYMLSFQVMNPILYAIWYRQRILIMFSSEERKAIFKFIDSFRKKPGVYDTLTIQRDYLATYWDEFALWNPMLFLIIDIFKFLKKGVTTICKIICKFFKLHSR